MSDLDAYTEYNVTIRARLKGSEHWSNASDTLSRTSAAGNRQIYAYYQAKSTEHGGLSLHRVGYLLLECVYRFLLQLRAAVHRFRPERTARWSVLTSQCLTATYCSSSGRSTTTHVVTASYTTTSSTTGRLCTITPSKQPVMTARCYFRGRLR